MPNRAAPAEGDSLQHALDALASALDDRDVGAQLAQRGVSTSLAQVALAGLRHYLEGRRERAGEDFATVSEEISRRVSLARLAAAPEENP